MHARLWNVPKQMGMCNVIAINRQFACLKRFFVKKETISYDSINRQFNLFIRLFITIVHICIHLFFTIYCSFTNKSKQTKQNLKNEN